MFDGVIYLYYCEKVQCTVQQAVFLPPIVFNFPLAVNSFLHYFFFLLRFFCFQHFLCPPPSFVDDTVDQAFIPSFVFASTLLFPNIDRKRSGSTG